MNVQSFSFFYAVLALACWAGAAAIVIGALVRRFGNPDAFAGLKFAYGRGARNPTHAPGRGVRGKAYQWNCSSSVEPVRAVTLDLPPWIAVVTSSK